MNMSEKYQEGSAAGSGAAAGAWGAGQAAPEGFRPEAGPQPGGLYQFWPQAGFVPVQCPTQGYAGQEQGPRYQPVQGAPYGGQQMSYGPQGMAQGMAQGGYAPQPEAGMYGGQGAAGAGMNTAGASAAEGLNHDQNRLGEMYGMVNDLMEGKADSSKILGFLGGSGGDFWKGALVGAAVVFLLNNKDVKDAVAGTLGAVFGGAAGAAAAEEPQEEQQ
jgi:hypothetical protein